MTNIPITASITACTVRFMRAKLDASNTDANIPSIHPKGKETTATAMTRYITARQQ